LVKPVDLIEELARLHGYDRIPEAFPLMTPLEPRVDPILALQNEIRNLTSGNNTITVPTGGSSVATGCLIIPPSGNTNTVTLKGVNGDTGISLHRTNPTFVGLNAVSSFVLNVLHASNVQTF